MKLRFKAAVIAVISLVVGVSIFWAVFQVPPPSNIPLTKNISPEPDVSVKQTTIGQRVFVSLSGCSYGWLASHNTHLTKSD